MIIDSTRKFAKPRRGVMIFQLNYVIPSGFGDSMPQFYNLAIPSGLFTA